MTAWERRDPIRDTKWYDEAACIGAEPELFWPNPAYRDGIETEWTKEAKAVCAACSVKAECLEDAIAADDDGIRGGLTYEERRALLRRRTRNRNAGRPSRAGHTPIHHGTGLGWRQHIRRREDPCPDCVKAHDIERDATLRKALADKHGKTSGYYTHLRLGEDACDPCKEAIRVKSAQVREEQRKARA